MAIGLEAPRKKKSSSKSPVLEPEDHLSRQLSVLKTMFDQKKDDDYYANFDYISQRALFTMKTRRASEFGDTTDLSPGRDAGDTVREDDLKEGSQARLQPTEPTREERTMKKLIAILLFAVATFAADAPDLSMQTRIRQEGLRNSKVMEIASGLTDGIGARLTGSPNMKRANEWTRDKLTEFGLSNAHLESWGPFGRGWTYESSSVRMTSPDVVQLNAIPKAWSPGTNGPLRGRPVKVKLETSEDLQKQKGKLAGKIVMSTEPTDAETARDARLSSL